MTRRVSERVVGGRRYRITDTPPGSTTVESHGPDGWETLPDDQAATVLAQLDTRRSSGSTESGR